MSHTEELQQGVLPQSSSDPRKSGGTQITTLVMAGTVALVCFGGVYGWFAYNSYLAESRVSGAKPVGFELSQRQRIARQVAATSDEQSTEDSESLIAEAVPGILANSVRQEPARVDVIAASAEIEASKPKRIEIGIAYGTEKRSWLTWVVEQFAGTVEGQRILVKLIPMGSVEGANAVLAGDQRIHVWAPASQMYLQTFLREWEAKYEGNPVLKGEELALTPMVIVMWKERHDAFMVKAPHVSMKMLYYAMRADTGWGAIAGKPEWGHFKLGHTHPNQSNSGLMSLILLAYGYHKKTDGLTVRDVMSQDFQEFLADFERGVTGLSNSTGNMMREMVHKGPVSFDALIVYESVAIDYFKRAEGRWGPLQVAYPRYNAWNDNPYYILNTSWTTPEHQEAAEVFLRFLMSEPIQTRALDHGFRPGNPEVPVLGPNSPFVRYKEFGLKVDLPAVCDPPTPEVIDNLQQSWIRNTVPR